MKKALVLAAIATGALVAASRTQRGQAIIDAAQNTNWGQKAFLYGGEAFGKVAGKN